MFCHLDPGTLTSRSRCGCHAGQARASTTKASLRVCKRSCTDGVKLGTIHATQKKVKKVDNYVSIAPGSLAPADQHAEVKGVSMAWHLQPQMLLIGTVELNSELMQFQHPPRFQSRRDALLFLQGAHCRTISTSILTLAASKLAGNCSGGCHNASYFVAPKSTPLAWHTSLLKPVMQCCSRILHGLASL